MAYENHNVLERYHQDYPHNLMSADVAFSELKKYLWLCQKHQKDREIAPNQIALHFECSMYPEMAEIDDIWHTFLLFTQDYQRFCINYLGQFIHHVPEVDFDPVDPEMLEIELTRYLSYIYDELGEETLKRWFNV